MAVGMEDFQSISVYGIRDGILMLLGKAGCVAVVEQGDYAAPCARALCQSPER
jgi:hypothetical protein